MLTFTHEFDDGWGQISDALYNVPSDAKIEFSNAENGIWLTANSEGFLYLARVFAELGLRKLAGGYHFHRPEWLKQPADEGQEVSISVYNGEWTANA